MTSSEHENDVIFHLFSFVLGGKTEPIIEEAFLDVNLLGVVQWAAAERLEEDLLFVIPQGIVIAGVYWACGGCLVHPDSL